MIRNPIAIAALMQSVVPDEHKHKFEAMAESFAYKAPELWPDCFWDMAKVVNELASEPLNPDTWQLKMVSIFTTKSELELLEQSNAT